MDRSRMVLAADKISSQVMLPSCLMFLTFFRSLGGSFKALMIKDIVPGDVTVVFDVLDLLSVPWWFFQGFDDQRRSGWNNGDLSLSVLDGQFDGDFQAFPFFGVFADIVTDLFWRETEWSDFWSQSSGWSDFSSDGSEFDDHDGGWIEFWGHIRRINTTFCKFDLRL